MTNQFLIRPAVQVGVGQACGGGVDGVVQQVRRGRLSAVFEYRGGDVEGG